MRGPLPTAKEEICGIRMAGPFQRDAMVAFLGMVADRNGESGQKRIDTERVKDFLESAYASGGFVTKL